MLLTAQPSLTIARIRSILRRAKVPSLLLTNLANIRYLTGLDLSAAALLLQSFGATLFINEHFEDIPANARKRLAVSSPDALKLFLKKRGKIGIESDAITAAQFIKWKRKYPYKKFVLLRGIIEEPRRTKSKRECQRILRACTITKRILRRILSMLRDGTSERELAWQIEVLARKRGAEAMAFGTIVAFGENTARPHHRPGNRRFRKGDLVQIDMGVVVDGYRSDYSRVYFTGKKTPEQSKVLRALRDAKASAERMLHAGVTNHALYREALSVLERHGFGVKEFPHALGHGVGLEIHEGIRLSVKGKEVRLRKNEVVTIEPGLYFADKWGMRIEDTHIVTK